MNQRIARGRQAEAAAWRWLRERGLLPVARNFRCRYGELDLIMLDGETLVVVEVRSRTSSSFTTPGLSVDWRKQAKIVNSTECFIARHPRFAQSPVRFDVVAVTGAGARDIDWIRDAFEPEY